MYIELKTHPDSHDDRGPARIGRITFNKTGKTLQYKDKKSTGEGKRKSCLIEPCGQNIIGVLLFKFVQ